MNKLEVEIAQAINRNSAEGGSNTPDFILAKMLTGVLTVFNETVRQRENWYGRRDYPGAQDAAEACETADPRVYRGNVFDDVGLARTFAPSVDEDRRVAEAYEQGYKSAFLEQDYATRERRSTALSYAVAAARKADTINDVLERARMFDNFLSGANEAKVVNRGTDSINPPGANPSRHRGTYFGKPLPDAD